MGKFFVAEPFPEHNPAGGPYPPFPRRNKAPVPLAQHLRAQPSQLSPYSSTACGMDMVMVMIHRAVRIVPTLRLSPVFRPVATHGNAWAPKKDQHLVLAVYPTEGLAFFPFTKTSLLQALLQKSPILAGTIFSRPPKRDLL